MKSLVYALGAFPQPSETFILQEVSALLDSELSVKVVSTALRPESLRPETRGGLIANWTAYPRASLPGEVANLSWVALRHPVATMRLLALNQRLLILPNHSRLRRLARAIHLLAIAGEPSVGHLHAHWTVPSDVAMMVGRVLGITYSFSMHAHDIYDEAPLVLGGSRRPGLEAKVRSARFVLCCTRAGRDQVLGLVRDAGVGRVVTHYHGVDTARFRPIASASPRQTPPLVVSAGRLIAYKGFDVLIEVFARLARRGVAFRSVIIGDGALRAALQAQVDRSGIADRVTLPGWKSHEEMSDILAGADAFALMSDERKGQHGLPNVLLEAMSCGLATLATPGPAIGELLEDGINGLLLPFDAGAASELMESVLTNPALRERLGQNGRRTVLSGFRLTEQSDSLVARFREALESET